MFTYEDGSKCRQRRELVAGLCQFHDPSRRDAALKRVRADQATARTRQTISVEPVADRFSDYLQNVSPEFSWHWPHLRLIQDALDKVTAGAIRDLMIFMPPRHGKTESTTIRYPAYRLQRNPKTRIILAAYAQTIANKYSRRMRKIVRSRVPLSDERTAVDDWETADGGGLRAVGVLGGVAGEGGDLIIVDDPVRGRRDVESAAQRDALESWWTDDLCTRAQPGAAKILILTRWHPDDLAGRILASEDAPNWHVIRLPAFAEENDPLGRGRVPCPRCDGERVDSEDVAVCRVCDGYGTVGAALCPELFDERALGRQKIVQGRGFSALYQQRPTAREGEMFRRDWFQVVDRAPAQGKRVRWWDQAASENSGDFTAGVKLCLSDDVVYVEDVVRGQWSPTRRDQKIRATAEADGTACQQWTEQEPGSAGKSAAEAFVRLLRGYPARFRPSSGSKELRADPLAAYAGTAKNVVLVKAAWNTVFLDELVDFPGRNDDMVDAAASAFSVLTQKMGGQPVSIPAGFHDDLTIQGESYDHHW